MIRIKMGLSGESLSDQGKRHRGSMAKVVTVAVAGAVEGIKLGMRQQLMSGGGKFDKFRNSIRSAVYPKPPRASLNAAGTVFAAGDAAERALTAFSTGPIVTPKHAKALAIPLHNYRGADGRLLGPKSSFFAGRLTYIPSRRRSASVSIGILATRAAGRASEIRRQLRTKGRARIAEHLAGEWIPQFILVRQVKLPKLLSPEQVVTKWANAVPGLIDRAMQMTVD